MSLTSRERILMALNHEETDRVPIDLGSSRSTGINAIAYNKLKKHLGITSDTILFDVKQLLAEADYELCLLYTSFRPECRIPIGIPNRDS